MTKQAITLDDVTVEHGTADWGGPTAKVTITAGPLKDRTFWLRSTAGLDDDIDLRKGGGIHLDASDPDVSHHGWRGVIETYDMDEALEALVEHVNDLALRRQIQDATWAETSALSEAWQAFTDSLEGASRRDFRAEWKRVREAVAAIEMAMAGMNRG